MIDDLGVGERVSVAVTRATDFSQITTLIIILFVILLIFSGYYIYRRLSKK